MVTISKEGQAALVSTMLRFTGSLYDSERRQWEALSYHAKVVWTREAQLSGLSVAIELFHDAYATGRVSETTTALIWR